VGKTQRERQGYYGKTPGVWDAVKDFKRARGYAMKMTKNVRNVWKYISVVCSLTSH